METMSQRLRRIRVKKGWALKEVAERAGIAISTYREWENGRQIRGEPYEKIAQALEVTLYELLTGKAPKSREYLIKIHEIELACKELRKNLESFISD